MFIVSVHEMYIDIFNAEVYKRDSEFWSLIAGWEIPGDPESTKVLVSSALALGSRDLVFLGKVMRTVLRPYSTLNLCIVLYQAFCQ